MKNLIYISILSLASMLIAALSADFGSIEGKLTDKSSGEPILFGNVALYDQSGKLITGVESDFDGKYLLTNIPPGIYDLEASYVGYQTQRTRDIVVKKDKVSKVDVQMSEGVVTNECVITAYKVPIIDFDNTSTGSTVTAEEIRSLPVKGIHAIAATSAGISKSTGDVSIRGSRANASVVYSVDGIRVFPSTPKPPGLIEKKKWAPSHPTYNANREQYNTIVENQFSSTVDQALSTFSIDVDRASYSNVRRHLLNGKLPPVNAVRIEEMINYFDYDYEGPSSDQPFKIHKTLVNCPWAPGHQLLHIGLQGKRVKTDDLPPSNFVFLIDVSGSMNNYKKLPLVKSSLKLLLNQMGEQDRVAIVTYAGKAGVALASTSVKEKKAISRVINNLGAGGSTAGAEGIHTAYEIASNHFIEGGNNRIILATDGDFNVGVSSQDGLEKLIEEKRKSGIFLSVLGFGMGNYQDGKMQTLANKGNGNHAYIDDMKEANKVFVKEFGGTLFTIAKDVKIQIEFNPAYVHNYRLIGYENRMLAKEDFNDDTKDAGELGAGHTVTAIYELIPIGIESTLTSSVDELIYQTSTSRPIVNTYKENGELATVKLRYKESDGKTSKKLVEVVDTKVVDVNKSDDKVKLSIGVAQFGNLLRNSVYKGEATYSDVLNLIEGIEGEEVSELRDLVLSADVAR